MLKKFVLSIPIIFPIWPNSFSTISVFTAPGRARVLQQLADGPIMVVISVDDKNPLAFLHISQRLL
jgi:hypothetical protein